MTRINAKLTPDLEGEEKRATLDTSEDSLLYVCVCWSVDSSPAWSLFDTNTIPCDCPVYVWSLAADTVHWLVNKMVLKKAYTNTRLISIMHPRAPDLLFPRLPWASSSSDVWQQAPSSWRQVTLFSCRLLTSDSRHQTHDGRWRCSRVVFWRLAAGTKLMTAGDVVLVSSSDVWQPAPSSWRQVTLFSCRLLTSDSRHQTHDGRWRCSRVVFWRLAAGTKLMTAGDVVLVSSSDVWQPAPSSWRQVTLFSCRLLTSDSRHQAHDGRWRCSRVVFWRLAAGTKLMTAGDVVLVSSSDVWQQAPSSWRQVTLFSCRLLTSGSRHQAHDGRWRCSRVVFWRLAAGTKLMTSGDVVLVSSSDVWQQAPSSWRQVTLFSCRLLTSGSRHQAHDFRWRCSRVVVWRLAAGTKLMTAGDVVLVSSSDVWQQAPSSWQQVTLFSCRLLTSDSRHQAHDCRWRCSRAVVAHDPSQALLRVTSVRSGRFTIGIWTFIYKIPRHVMSGTSHFFLMGAICWIIPNIYGMGAFWWVNY